MSDDQGFKRRIDEAAAKLGESYLDELAQYAESLLLSQEKAREHDAAYEREQAERAEFEVWKAAQRASFEAWKAAAYNSPPVCAGHDFDALSGRCFKCNATPVKP